MKLFLIGNPVDVVNREVRGLIFKVEVITGPKHYSTQHKISLLMDGFHKGLAFEKKEDANSYILQEKLSYSERSAYSLYKSFYNGPYNAPFVYEIEANVDEQKQETITINENGAKREVTCYRLDKDIIDTCEIISISLNNITEVVPNSAAAKDSLIDITKFRALYAAQYNRAFFTNPFSVMNKMLGNNPGMKMSAVYEYADTHLDSRTIEILYGPKK